MATECCTVQLYAKNVQTTRFCIFNGLCFADLEHRKTGTKCWYKKQQTGGGNKFPFLTILSEVHEIVGHKTMEMTIRYSYHLSQEHKKKAVNLIEPTNRQRCLSEKCHKCWSGLCNLLNFTRKLSRQHRSRGRVSHPFVTNSCGEGTCCRRLQNSTEQI